MIEFILVLLLGKSIVLTPEPINLSGTHEISLTAPIKAVSSGARIGVDVSSIVSIRPDESLVDFRDRVGREFPSMSMSALLQSSEGKSIKLIYSGNVEIGKSTVVLSLTSGNAFPTNQAFNRLTVTSTVQAKGVKVIWTNYSP